ncbi:transglutaminaseTgpA domain-containing protein, partial [Streptomyces bambusae]
MSGRARLTIFALLATLLTSASLLPLVRPATWLLQAAVLLAVQSGVGAAARRVPLARSLTVAVQVLLSLLLLALLFLGEGEQSAEGGVLSYLVNDFGGLFQQGARDVAEFAIPAPLTPGIRLLLVCGVLVVGLLVDLLAVTFRTAAAAGLPLLALYSVAAGLSASGSASWLWFLLAGCGYLLLLLAEGRDRLTQWGRVFGGGARPAAGGSAARGGPLAPGGPPPRQRPPPARGFAYASGDRSPPRPGPGVHPQHSSGGRRDRLRTEPVPGVAEHFLHRDTGRRDRP